MEVIVLLALLYGYINGLHGSASIVATLISTRAVAPRAALFTAAIGVTIGPFVLGVAVARTIGAEIIHSEAATTEVAIAALASTIGWNLFTLWLNIPTSFSQSLVGSLVGAAFAGYGQQAVLSAGLTKALLGLFLSPLLGMAASAMIIKLIYKLGVFASPRINRWFNRGQIPVAFLVAISFGANDGQKIMGMITLGLVATGKISTFVIPDWVIAISAAAIGLGTFTGGRRLIRTLGGKFFKIRPVEGFGAQMASGIVLFISGIIGAPVSSSQVVTSAIVGAGSADRIQKVRWLQFQRILIGWIITIPMSAALSAAILLLERTL